MIRTAFIFQHYPPFPGAGARRAKSIVKSYGESRSSETERLYLLTTEAVPDEPYANVVTFSRSKAGNKRSFVLRAVEETVLGLKIALHLAIKRYDRVVMSTPSYLAAVPVSYVLNLMRTPYVIELRDVYPESFAEAKVLQKDSIIYRLMVFVSSRMYSNAAGILCATNGIKKLLSPYEDLPPVNVVYNGFDEVYNPSDIDKYEDFTVCFHGVLGHFQDVQGLVIVADKLQKQGIKLLVIGYGPKEAVLGLSKNIIFLGKKPHDETMQIIAKCHVGLSLRSNDLISINSFPVKVWEYVGMKVPCIVSPLSEAGDFVESNGFGRQVNFGDYDEIVDIIMDYKRSLKHSSNDDVIARYTRRETGRAAANTIADYFTQHA